MFESILSVAGPLISGMMGSDSAENAGQIQADATRESIAEQRRQYDMTRLDLAPYRDAGNEALTTLRRMMGSGGVSVDKEKFRIGEGLKSVRVTAENFDPEAYLRGNPDVANSKYASDPFAHWQEWGKNEPRMQTLAATVYDEDAYNRAVKEAKASAGEYGDSPLMRQFSSSDLANDVVYNSSGIVKAASGIDPAAMTRKFTIADFYDDPVVKLGMQFGLDEGRKGIDRGAGAAGLRNSGQTLKALTRFGTDYAGGMAEGSNNRYLGERQNLRDLLAYRDVMTAGAEDRFTGKQDRTYNQLAGLAGTGQNATGTGAALGTQLSGNIANLISAGGNAKAASGIAGGNAWGNAFSTIGNWWNQNQMLDKLTNRGASSVFKPAYTGYGAAGDYQYG